MNTDAIPMKNVDPPYSRRSVMLRVMASPAWLLLVVVLSFFWQLGTMPLYDLDEGTFSQTTHEMLKGGSYITPHCDGEPCYDGSMLPHWLQAASIQVFGFDEFGLRLPSALAAGIWVLALWFFVRERLDAPTATVAGLALALSLLVSLIGKAAMADALLNLFITLTFFEIYRYWLALDPKSDRRFILRAYLWMALGFLSKGLVAIFLPLVVSLLFVLSSLRWSKASLLALWYWLRAVFNPLGWSILLLVAGSWSLAVYFEDGIGFFKSIFLDWNPARFDAVIDGHQGRAWDYPIMLFALLMPFTGWVLSLFKCYRSAWLDPLDRFLWIWFLVVLVFFSISGFELPQDLLYSATPLIILMARHRQALTNHWLAFGPPLIFFGLLLILPFILDVAMVVSSRPYDVILFEEGRHGITLEYGVATLAGLLLTFLMLRWSSPQLWQRLVLVGVVQLLVVHCEVLPRALDTLQAPVKEAALIAKRTDLPTVVYRTSMPSFSVYREAMTPDRAPKPGELVFLRIDKLEELSRKHPEMDWELVYHRGHVVLLRSKPID